MIFAIIAIAGLVVGCVVGYLIFRYVLTGKYKEMLANAEKAAERAARRAAAEEEYFLAANVVNLR